MNKKNILAEIETLAQKNNSLFEENSNLKTEQQELLCKIAMLEKEIETLTVTVAEKEALILDLKNRNINEEYVEPISISKDDAVIDTPADTVINVAEIKETEIVSVDYGTGVDMASEAIGTVVLKCSELCAHFAEAGGPNAKDLINLALGRTEVFKSEALSVIEAIDDITEISAELSKRMENTFDYFDLLKKQL